MCGRLELSIVVAMSATEMHPSSQARVGRLVSGTLQLLLQGFACPHEPHPSLKNYAALHAPNALSGSTSAPTIRTMMDASFLQMKGMGKHGGDHCLPYLILDAHRIGIDSLLASDPF
jgi:hypothetical protein